MSIFVSELFSCSTLDELYNSFLLSILLIGLLKASTKSNAIATLSEKIIFSL